MSSVVQNIMIRVGATDMTGPGYRSVIANTHRMKRNVEGVGGAARMAAGRGGIGAITMGLGGALVSTAALATGFAAVAGAGAALGGIVSTGASLETEMANVQAVTGATAQQMMALTRQAENLGRTTPWSANQAAEAMAFMGMAGFNTRQIYDALPGTLDLATAGSLGVAEAADIATNVMAGMGLEASQMTNAANVLTRAFTSSNTNLMQLGDAFKYVGPMAKAAGYDIEETAAAIGVLSNAGIQGDMAGTTLRGVLLTLSDAAKQVQLRELGVEVLDAAGNMRPLADIIDDTNAALQGLGGGERLGKVGEIFPNRQATGFAELLSKGGDELRRMEAQMRTGATAAEVAAGKQDNLAGDATKATSALSGLGITLYKLVGPAMRWVVQTFTSGINWITTGIRSFVTENADTIASYLNMARGWFGLLGRIIGNAAKAWGWLFSTVGSIITGNGTTIGWWVKAVTKGMTFVGYVFSNWMNIGRYALYTVGHAFVRVGNQIRYIVEDVIGGTISWMIGTVWGNLSILGDGMTGFFTSLTGNIVGVVKNLPSLIAGNMDLSEIWKPVTEEFRAMVFEPLTIEARAEGDLEKSMRESRDAAERELINSATGYQAKNDQLATSLRGLFDDEDVAPQGPGGVPQLAGQGFPQTPSAFAFGEQGGPPDQGGFGPVATRGAAAAFPGQQAYDPQFGIATRRGTPVDGGAMEVISDTRDLLRQTQGRGGSNQTVLDKLLQRVDHLVVLLEAAPLVRVARPQGGRA